MRHLGSPGQPSEARVDEPSDIDRVLQEAQHRSSSVRTRAFPGGGGGIAADDLRTSYPSESEKTRNLSPMWSEEWQGSWDMVGVCTRRGGVALASEVVPPGLHPRPLALRRVHVVEHLRQQISPIIKPTGLLLRPSRSHLLEGEPVHVVHLGPGPARCENQPVCETDAVVAV